MAHEGLTAGRLVTTLDDWTMRCPGYHLCDASRGSLSALSLVVDALRLPAAG